LISTTSVASSHFTSRNQNRFMLKCLLKDRSDLTARFTPQPSCNNAPFKTYEGWNFNSGNYLFTTDTK